MASPRMESLEWEGEREPSLDDLPPMQAAGGKKKRWLSHPHLLSDRSKALWLENFRFEKKSFRSLTVIALLEGEG